MIEPEDGWLNQVWNANDIHVPTIENMDMLLAADNDVQFCIPPCQVGDADTEVIRMWKSVPILAKYVHLVLTGSRTPCQVWEVLMLAIHADNVLGECDLLIQWLCAALMQVTLAQGGNNVTLVRLGPIIPVMMDMFLASHQVALLDQDLLNCLGGTCMVANVVNQGISELVNSLGGL